MKAAVLDRYVKGDVNLSVREVPIPECGPGKVLVKVTCAGVNPVDNMIARGEVKLICGYEMPLVMGNELVGTVEQVGEGVEGFEAGERVYARLPLESIGAFAEFAAIDAAALAKVPGEFSDEEAAAVPLTALTAMQAIDLLGIDGGRLFISGGTGSFGAMAIPLARARGFEVATSGSARNEQRVRELGAGTFIDYKTQDYAQVLSGVDAVIDSVGGDEVERELGILRDGGTLVTLRGMPNGDFARRSGMGALKRTMFGMAGRKLDRLAARRGQRYRFVFVHSDGPQLARATEILMERGVRPAVDEVFEFEQVNDALHKVDVGGSRGKTVLRIG